MTVLHLGSFLLALLLCFILTRIVRNFAVVRGWVCAPVLERHLHTKPVPRLGGVAIFLAFLGSLGIALLVARTFFQLDLGFPVRSLFTILLPASLIFLLGVYDDMRGASPSMKFTVQALAATMLYAGGLRILQLPILYGRNEFPWFVGLPLTILWVLAITNAFNLIDGLDGLAAGSALFSTVVVFVVALVSHTPLLSLMTIALAGAILGFLRFNFNPATIFLGDCGSLFIGFLLSALSLRGAQKAPTLVAVAIPVVSFGLPILETGLSVMRRLISGRPVFTADREHIHHKLLQLGFSHRQGVIVLYGVSALFALLSLFLLWPTGSSLGLVLAVLGIGIWLGVQHLGYLEFGELRRVAQRAIEQPQIFVNNLAIRRATQELRVARDYDQICRILAAAFDSNDFDALELNANLLPGDYSVFEAAHLNSTHTGDLCFGWSKPGVSAPRGRFMAWSLTLDLITTANRRRGSLSIYRLYTQRDLQLDVNLLTAIFPVALADALERTLSPAVDLAPRVEQGSRVLSAHAG